VLKVSDAGNAKNRPITIVLIFRPASLHNTTFNMDAFSLDCDTVSFLSSLSSDSLNDDGYFAEEFLLEEDLKYPSNVVKICFDLHTVKSEGEYTFTTILTVDEYETSSSMPEERQDSSERLSHEQQAERADLALSESDDGLLAIIQDIRQCLDDQMRTSESSKGKTEDLSRGVDDTRDLDYKRCQTRRSLMNLNNKMRLAKSVGVCKPGDRQQPSKPVDDDKTPRKSLQELRLQKQSSLKNLMRVCHKVLIMA
jgi:hypothetical protein